jgi:AAA family ATP:ADP antiporter
MLRRLVLVRPGETKALALSAAYFFFVLLSYYLLRPVRETFGIQRGWEVLPLLMTGTLLVMLLANPLYTWLVSKTPRKQFIPLTYRFFAANMLLFYLAFLIVPDAHRTTIGYCFYIWLSVFNLFVVSIFWAFMSDLWTREQGARLFGAVGVGGTLGAIVGAAVTGWLMQGLTLGETTLQVSAPTMMLLAIVPLEIAVQCVKRLMRASAVDRERFDNAPMLRPSEPGPGAWKGLALIARSPYLLLICIYMLLFTTTSTYLYLEQGRIIEDTFSEQHERTAAFANIDLWVNVLTLATQLFITGRLIRAIGIGPALSIVPALTIVGFVGLWAAPGYGMLVVFQTVRRAMHYAIDRPAREVLYTVVSQDARYKSKSFIDTFIYRAGDMTGAWTGRALGLAGVAIGIIAAPLAAMWMLVALILGWRQRIEAERGEHTSTAGQAPRP